MNDYIICMDASGDIIREIAQENGIEFVPMEYSLGEEMRTSHGCEDETVLKRFYDGQRGGDLTRTSQISPFMYEEYFGKFLKEGKSVLYFCLSSGLSATYEGSMLAARNLKETYPGKEVLPIDTLAATGGIGILAERAVENRKKGMSLHENFDAVTALVPKLRHFFMVQDLMYLKRGGRVSAATAIVGSALNIKPMLKIDENGKLVTIDKKRGNKAAMMSLFSYFKDNYNPELGNTVYICDADTPQLAEALAEKVKAEAPDVAVRRTMLSPIIGAHTGPGMLSMILLGK
ncbi:MAG: DegV family protein [Lachnospiraceae bacterium]|jgi:DegV family protein with EDD domain|nr:DegV family protein [uncultured Acetatifactor sp.]MCI9232237.1 DegV family protein [Lachnospiraceae bacterium]MCI9572036.1 DegV family protein [Lachnospiraceae bacterium]